MSLRLGSVAGIPVRAHWLFALLVGLLLWKDGAMGGTPAVVNTLLLLGILFGSVVLHEFGHALTARRFGARIVDITLWPLGGLTRMTHMPERPVPEVCVALAGPAVNAAILAAAALTGADVRMPWGTGASGTSLGVTETLHYVDVLASVNFALAFFNLAPAFPMDGGRALRGALAARFGYLHATEIAVKVGRWFAVLAVVAAYLYTDVFVPVLLIGLFLWFQGAQELAMVRARHGTHPLQRALWERLGATGDGERGGGAGSRRYEGDRDLTRELEGFRGSMDEFFRRRDGGS